MKTLIPKKIQESVTRFFNSPIKVFILLAGIFGVLTIVLAPPLTGADEEAHFVRAYGISEGDFRLYNTNKVEVPKSYRQTLGCFQTKTPEPGKTYSYRYANYGIEKKEAFRCALDLPLNQHDAESVRTSAGAYSPTSYIPQTLAVLLGKLLNLPIVAIVYLIRFFTLLAYMVLIIVAIKLLPVRKWALVGVALLPHSINNIINPGGDYMLFGMAALLTAVVVRSVYISKEELEKENRTLLTILAVSVFFLVLPKGPFPGVCFLPLVAFYGGLKYERIKKASIILILLMVAILWYIVGVSAVASWRGSEDYTSILDFPYAFVKTMFFHWVDTDFIQMGHSMRAGNYLGMPSIAITLLNILFAIYLFVGYPERARIRISALQTKLLNYTGLIISIGVVLGSFAALFISASYLQDDSLVINGVQTRYFYPAFFMLAPLPLTRNFYARSVKNFSRILTVGSLLLLTIHVLLIAIYFHWV